MKHIINTDLDPKLPFPNAAIEENMKYGEIEFDPSKYELYLDESQKSGYVTGHNLRKELKDKKPVNAAFMDYLEAHPELVPDSWKTNADGERNYIYAWGTIFRSSDDNLFVRFWYWFDGKLVSFCDWLDYDWGGRSPALVPASASELSPSLQALDLSVLENRIAALEVWRERVQMP